MVSEKDLNVFKIQMEIKKKKERLRKFLSVNKKLRVVGSLKNVWEDDGKWMF